VIAEIIEKHIVSFAVYRQRSNVRAPALRIATENVIFVTAWTSLESDAAEMDGDRITPTPACPSCGNPALFHHGLLVSVPEEADCSNKDDAASLSRLFGS
jgi:hypothetical protein